MATMTSLIFSIDLDSVVGDFVASFRKSVATTKGIDPLTMGEPVSWDFVGTPGWGIKDRGEFFDLRNIAIERHRIFRDMALFDGVSKALKTLSRAGVVTNLIAHRLPYSSHGLVVSDSLEWLSKNHIPLRYISFDKDVPITPADLYVNGAPDNIVALQAIHGMDRVVIFDHPYNRHLSGVRVGNWDELAESILTTQHQWSLVY